MTHLSELSENDFNKDLDISRENNLLYYHMFQILGGKA